MGFVCIKGFTVRVKSSGVVYEQVKGHSTVLQRYSVTAGKLFGIT